MDPWKVSDQIRAYLTRKGMEIDESHRQHIERLIRAEAKADAAPPPDPSLVQASPENLEKARVDISGWRRFRRRPTTKWSAKELRALRNAFPVARPDYSAIKRYYNSILPDDDDYRRRNIITMLNNWAGEVDKAHRWIDEQSMSAAAKTPPRKTDYTKII